MIQNPDIFKFTHNQEIFMRTVPVFFMITGFLLIDSDKKLDYKISLRIQNLSGRKNYDRNLTVEEEALVNCRHSF